MGKRRAEPLLCPAPCKRRARQPAAAPRAAAAPAAAPAAPRAAAKRQLEEAEAPPAKRPGLRGGGGGGPRAEQAEQAEAAERRPRRGAAAAQEARAAAGRGPERAAGKQEEEFCQYNSFLYWRAPLPTLDLSDIQDLETGSPSPSGSLSRDGETVPETKTALRTDTMETEMET